MRHSRKLLKAVNLLTLVLLILGTLFFGLMGGWLYGHMGFLGLLVAGIMIIAIPVVAYFIELSTTKYDERKARFNILFLLAIYFFLSQIWLGFHENGL